MPRKASSFVYFTRLSIENVRAFGGQQKLVVADERGDPARWTLIVGENGVGKTTLLQSLAWMRPLFNVDEERNKRYVEPALSRDENIDIDTLARTSKGRIIASVEATLTVGSRLGRHRGKTKTIKTSISIHRRKGVTVDIQTSQEKLKSFSDPLILGYGAGRHLGYSNLDKGLIDPIESLFNPAVELYDVEEILFRLDYHARRLRPHARKRLEKLKAALTAVLPDVRSTTDIQIEGPRAAGVDEQKTGIYVRTPYGRVPFKELSLGYKTVTAWTVDIAWRLFEHYPDSSDPLSEPAIVLVDEIDLHLHPRWQRHIRRDLTTYFPNIQFIVTAHSPLMVQSYLDENLAVVRREHDRSVINNDPVVVRGWRLDQVVTSELFDFESSRPPEIEAKLERRAKLVRKPRRSAAEETELKKLDRAVEDLPTTEDPGDQKAMDIVREAAELLRTRPTKRR